MKSQLYIPKRIRVGFQKREDTFSKRLAYIIYYDDKGNLRKETSWSSWRDQKIEPEEYDNLPQSGLIINKDINRYNWGHFSSHRTMIRVYDPRGIEFEITTENLIGVLMNSDCSKRELSGEYVFAYSGKDLVLLPTSSEEYQKATTYTALQSTKISAKDLVPGCSYKTKKQLDLVYVGRFMWYEQYSWVYKNKSTRIGKKQHIFANIKSDKIYFEPKSNLEFLAQRNSDEIISNYAEIIEKFKTNTRSANIVKFELVSADIKESPDTSDKYNNYSHKIYYIQEGNFIYSVRVTSEYQYVSQSEYKLRGYNYTKQYPFNLDTKSTVIEEPTRSGYNYNYFSRVYYNFSQIKALNLCDLYVILDNGNRIKAHIHEI